MVPRLHAAQEGEAREKPKEHHPAFCRSPPHPCHPRNLVRLKKIFFLSVLTASDSNGNCLLHTTVCPARPLLLDANMLDANISVGQRVVALEKETSEPPRGKREKAG